MGTAAASRSPTPAFLAAAVALLALYTLARTGDRLTWLLEATPVLVGLPLLAATRRRFPLTPLLYAALFVHALVLLHGAQYTYAKTPLGFALAELLGTQRNPWDRLGHLMQGITPALAAREILVRKRFLGRGPMLAFLCACVALAVSAFYELIEWWVALAAGAQSEAFLGTQGDVWDTQADMACALVGALGALLALRGLQDRQIGALDAQERR